MAKAINVAFGIGIAIVLVLVITLGVKVFYPGPERPDYPSVSFDDPNRDLEYQQYDQELEEYRNDAESYGSRLFFIYNIIGMILVIVSMFLMKWTNISSGVAFSGIVLIMWGFGSGWSGTEDIWKFLMGVIITALLITLAILVHKRHEAKKI